MSLEQMSDDQILKEKKLGSECYCVRGTPRIT